MHQEHLEPGERYEEVARTTRHILSVGAARVDELATRHTSTACDGIHGMRVVRLRDLMMPIWAGVFAEIVFGDAWPREARGLIVANADDIVTALKCCGLRHMDRRHRLTRYLAGRLDQVPHRLPAGLNPRERALYLQGTFFNTAVVQMSEAMAHLLMVLAHHPDLQAELAAHPDDRQRFDRIMNETMRMYPLFGIAHRIATDDIALDGSTLPAGSVLCFNYPEFHRAGFDHADRFDDHVWLAAHPGSRPSR